MNCEININSVSKNGEGSRWRFEKEKNKPQLSYFFIILCEPAYACTNRKGEEVSA